MEYCKILWTQFSKISQAREKCSTSLGSVLNNSEPLTLKEFSNDVSVFEIETRLMQLEWDKSFVSLPNGKILFGPEYDALMMVLPKTIYKSVDQLVYSGSDHYLSEEGHLEYLGLGPNIDDLSPFSRMMHMEILSLGSNRITDLTPLTGLKKLTRLDLRGNQITDLSPLLSMAGLKHLEIQYIPALDDPDQQKLIRLLQEKGVHVITRDYR